MKPDSTRYLAHFTSLKKGETGVTALDKIVKILNEKKILASSVPYTGAKVVCLTECPWTSLIEHANNYSPFGIGFSKEFVFSRHGNPVFYIRPDLFKKQMSSTKKPFHEHVYPFITPFIPYYCPLNERGGKKMCDYTHEREWRVPHDLPFEYSDIAFIVLEDYEAMAKFPKELKDEIGREKFVLLDSRSSPRLLDFLVGIE